MGGGSWFSGALPRALDVNLTNPVGVLRSADAATVNSSFEKRVRVIHTLLSCRPQREGHARCSIKPVLTEGKKAPKTKAIGRSCPFWTRRSRAIFCVPSPNACRNYGNSWGRSFQKGERNLAMSILRSHRFWQQKRKLSKITSPRKDTAQKAPGLKSMNLRIGRRLRKAQTLAARRPRKQTAFRNFHVAFKSFHNFRRPIRDPRIFACSGRAPWKTSTRRLSQERHSDFLSEG